MLDGWDALITVVEMQPGAVCDSTADEILQQTLGESSGKTVEGSETAGTLLPPIRRLDRVPALASRQEFTSRLLGVCQPTQAKQAPSIARQNQADIGTHDPMSGSVILLSSRTGGRRAVCVKNADSNVYKGLQVEGSQEIRSQPGQCVIHAANEQICVLHGSQGGESQDRVCDHDRWSTSQQVLVL